MGDPELSSDEKILVRTQGVYIKSTPFEGSLTNKRIILIDRAKNLLPTKEIPLGSIQGVEPGENAIRDQIITLSVLTKTGELRQMILTFSRQAGGNRIKERDMWVRIIKENLSSPSNQAIRKVIPEPAPRRAELASGPTYEIVRSTLPQTPPTGDTRPAADVDGMSPVRRSSITSTAAPLPPSPAVRQSDTSSMGISVFCPKCGSKIPAESVFCNRCGSPVARKTADSIKIPALPAVLKIPATRTIDEEIRSIEPLIEPSMDKIPPDALRAATAESLRKQTALREGKEESVSPSVSTGQVPEAKTPGISQILPAESATAPAPFSASSSTTNDTPPPPKPPKRHGFMPNMKTIFTAAIVLFVVLFVAGFAMVVLPMLNGDGVTAPPTSGDVTPTPAPTSPLVLATGKIVIRETQAPALPATGVYVHVSYLGGFKGTYGIPGMLTTVHGNSGDRVWEVENASGTVQATFEKLDGSSHELLVEIYKDGKALTSGTTTVGHGSVALSVDTATGIAAAPVTSGGSTSKTTTTFV
jgi:hypothetical protein